MEEIDRQMAKARLEGVSKWQKMEENVASMAFIAKTNTTA